VKAPREIERRIAHSSVAPVNYPDHAAVAAEDVLGPEVGMDEYGHEVELWDAYEHALGPLTLSRPEQREDASSEILTEAAEPLTPRRRVETRKTEGLCARDREAV